MSNILKIEPLFNYFSNNFKKLSLSLACFLTAKLTHMRKYTETLSGIIESSGLNLNQISKVSGISNAYLTKLIKGNINKPGKDKIASILLALNYSMTDINGVLAEYDYMPLNRHDIPDILDNNRRRKFEGRILPQFDNIYFELLMAALGKYRRYQDSG
jgi:transcriptional regulator with XRE-family HTH domain